MDAVAWAKKSKPTELMMWEMAHGRIWTLWHPTISRLEGKHTHTQTNIQTNRSIDRQTNRSIDKRQFCLKTPLDVKSKINNQAHGRELVWAPATIGGIKPAGNLSFLRGRKWQCCSRQLNARAHGASFSSQEIGLATSEP